MTWWLARPTPDEVQGQALPSGSARSVANGGWVWDVRQRALVAR